MGWKGSESPPQCSGIFQSHHLVTAVRFPSMKLLSCLAQFFIVTFSMSTFVRAKQYLQPWEQPEYVSSLMGYSHKTA